MKDETTKKIWSLKLDYKKHESIRDIAQNNMNNLSQEIFELEYPIMAWQELEDWLKRNRPKGKYQNNPIVKRLDGHESAPCFITQEGELQVGAYYHYDGFPRGKDIRVHFEFKSWR